MSQTEKTKSESNSNVSDFLTAPRKKRKNYVILAVSKPLDAEFTGLVEGYLKKAFPGLSLSQPKTIAELTRQFGRNISLLIVSDEFDNAEEKRIIELIRALKEKRRDDAIPILFVTRQAQKLITDYHQELLAFHETDEYIEYPVTNRQQLFSRIKAGIETKNKRRGRRYKISLETNFFLLSKDRHFSAEIQDLSLYGALIQAEDGCMFRAGDQLGLSIPITGLLPSNEGDFLKISAKVRRVYISGTSAGISFEHLSTSQLQKLTALLSSLVTRDLGRKAAKFKIAPANPASRKKDKK